MSFISNRTAVGSKDASTEAVGQPLSIKETSTEAVGEPPNLTASTPSPTQKSVGKEEKKEALVPENNAVDRNASTSTNRTKAAAASLLGNTQSVLQQGMFASGVT